MPNYKCRVVLFAQGGHLATEFELPFVPFEGLFLEFPESQIGSVQDVTWNLSEKRFDLTLDNFIASEDPEELRKAGFVDA